MVQAWFQASYQPKLGFCSLCKWCADTKAVSKSPQSTGLHDGMADPELYKHVEITKQLATLLGVAKTDQVLVILSMIETMNVNCTSTSQCVRASAQTVS